MIGEDKMYNFAEGGFGMTEFEKLVAALKLSHADDWPRQVLYFAISHDDRKLLRIHVPGLLEWLEKMVKAGVKKEEESNGVQGE